MKFVNVFFFPFKLIFYILHILYLDFKLCLKTGWIPIIEMFEVYQEDWNETKNIDSWYKESKKFLIKLINNKSRIVPY